MYYNNRGYSDSFFSISVKHASKWIKRRHRSCERTNKTSACRVQKKTLKVNKIIFIPAEQCWIHPTKRAVATASSHIEEGSMAYICRVIVVRISHDQLHWQTTHAGWTSRTASDNYERKTRGQCGIYSEYSAAIGPTAAQRTQPAWGNVVSREGASSLSVSVSS